jgi:hypothetical protein
MVQNSSSEADRLSDSQEFTYFLFIRKVRYRIHNSRPLDPILCQINPVHNFQIHLCKIDVNIILPSTSRCCRWSLSFSFPRQKPVCLSLYSTSPTCFVHLVLLDLIMPIIHLLRSANHGVPHYEIITAGCLCSNKFLNILFPKTSIYVAILGRQSRI